jgi:hypothetical protein
MVDVAEAKDAEGFGLVSIENLMVATGNVRIRVLRGSPGGTRHLLKAVLDPGEKVELLVLPDEDFTIQHGET